MKRIVVAPHKLVMASAAFIFAGITMATTIFATTAFAEPATKTTTFDVEITDFLTITLDQSDNIAHLNINTRFNTGSIVASVATNNVAGYTLSLQDADERNGLERSGYETAAAEDKPLYDIPSVTADTEYASLTDDTWGYFLGDTTAIEATYKVIPLSATEIASSDSPTAPAESTTVNFGVKIAATRPQGLYKDTLTFTAVANIVDPDPVDPDPDTTTFDEAFAAAEKVKDATSGKYKMQDMSSTICSAVTKEQTTTLVDSRDGTIYNVGKLADDKCWLLDNLALDLLAQDASTKITADNTNADATSLNALFNGGRDATTNPDGNLPTAGVADWTSSYSYSAPLVNLASKDVEPTYDEYESADEPLASEVRAGHWKVGGYYNYCAASAGSYCYGNGDSAGISATGNASSDICPAGWRMPTGGTYGEYQLLANAITGGTSNWIDTEPEYSNIRKSLSLPLSGSFYYGSSYSQGSYGYFWSSTYYGSSSMYTLNAYTSNIRPQSSDSRYGGISVRCIAQ